MSRVYFTSDWHLGHKNILKYRPQFKSIEEHDNTFITNFNETISKRDIVYFLGDIVFTDDALEQFKQLRYCRKILYLGNHDYLHSTKYTGVFDEVYGIRSFKSYWLSHCPIHPQEMRNRKGNIHGHLHNNYVQNPGYESRDTRYYNVSPEKNDFKLVNFEDIKRYFDEH